MFACWIMLEIPTYDRVNIKINLLSNFFHAVRSTTQWKVHCQMTSVPPQSRQWIDMLSATPDYLEDPAMVVVCEHMQYHDKKAMSKTCHAIYSFMHA